MALEAAERSTSRFTGRRKREHPGMAWTVETSEPSCSDTLPPTVHSYPTRSDPLVLLK